MANAVSVILCSWALLSCVDALVNTNSTGTHKTPAVVLDNEFSLVICVYLTVYVQKAKVLGAMTPE